MIEFERNTWSKINLLIVEDINARGGEKERKRYCKE